MSRTVKITETPRQGLSAVNPRLGPQYEQLVDLLSRRLGAAHARLLAEPAPVALAGSARAGLAWFAEGDGPARALIELSVGERLALEAEASRLLSEIAAFADQLEREGETSHDLARLLRDALVTPDEGNLWSVDGAPVLVAWGYRAAGASDPVTERASAITATAAAPPSPQPPPRPASPPPRHEEGPTAPSPRPPLRSFAWSLAGTNALLWLGALILAALLGARLLHACAVGSPGWPEWLRASLPSYCLASVAEPDPEEAAILTAIRAVERDVHDAEIALSRRAAACEVSCLPSRAAVAEPPRAISQDVARRLENIERGRTLELTLAWEGPSDLDVFVTCPNQFEINFGSTKGCGARLVADQNRGGGAPDSRPIEHVIWDGPPSPEGTYRVAVALYRRHGDTRPVIPFRVLLSRGGQVLREEAGEVSSLETRHLTLSFIAPLSPPVQAARP
jgi:hypothetical protein